MYRPQSQFPHSCVRVSERFIYSHDRSANSAAGNIWTNPGNISIAHRHTNVEIRTEAAQFSEKEYINWIFLAVQRLYCIEACRDQRHFSRDRWRGTTACPACWAMGDKWSEIVSGEKKYFVLGRLEQPSQDKKFGSLAFLSFTTPFFLLQAFISDTRLSLLVAQFSFQLTIFFLCNKAELSSLLPNFPLWM